MCWVRSRHHPPCLVERMRLPLGRKWRNANSSCILYVDNMSSNRAVYMNNRNFNLKHQYLYINVYRLNAYIIYMLFKCSSGEAPHLNILLFRYHVVRLWFYVGRQQPRLLVHYPGVALDSNISRWNVRLTQIVTWIAAQWSRIILLSTFFL